MRRFAVLAAIALTSFSLAACGGDEEERASDPAPAAADANAPSPPGEDEKVYWDGGTIEEEYVNGSKHEGNSVVALSAINGELQPGSYAQMPTTCEGTDLRVDLIAELGGTVPIDGGEVSAEGDPREGQVVTGHMSLTGEIAEQGRGTGTVTATDIEYDDGSAVHACEDIERDVTLRAPAYAAPVDGPSEEYFGSSVVGDPVALRVSPDGKEVVTARASHFLICPSQGGEDVTVNGDTTATAYPPAPIKPDGTFKLEAQYSTTNAGVFVGDKRVEGGGMLFTTITGKLDGGEIVDGKYQAYLDFFEGFTPGDDGFDTSAKDGFSAACGTEGPDGKPTDQAVELLLAG